MNARAAETFSERTVRTMLGVLGAVVLPASVISTLAKGVSVLDGLWWGIVTASVAATIVSTRHALRRQEPTDA